MHFYEVVQDRLEDRGKVTSLPNGMTLHVQEDHRFPLVVLRMYIHAGSAYEREDEAGMSHLLEHMAFRGHGRASEISLAQEIESIGGSLNAATSFDYTVYMLDVPAQNWALGLDVLYQLCFEISFADQELEVEKQVVLSELEQNLESPKHCLFQSVQKQVWQGREYERPVIGFRDSIRQITKEHIDSYVRRVYQPQSMVCIVCGDVKEDEVLEHANNLLGHLPNTLLQTESRSIDRSHEETGPVIVCKESAWQTVHMGIGYPLPNLSSPDSEALEVLAYILGGDKTSHFYKLFQYEESLAQDVSVSPIFLEREGMFYIQAQMEEGKAASFWERFVQVMSADLVESITQEEIERAVFNIQDGIFQIKETLSGFASKIGYFLFFEKRLEAEEQYFYQLAHVTRDDLIAVFKRYLRPGLLRATFLIPQSSALCSRNFWERSQKIWAQTFKATPGSSQKRWPSHEKSLSLAKACHLVLLPDKTLPYTAVDLTWSGADALCSSSQQGLACLTAKALVRGTKDRTATQIQTFLAQRAALVDAQASRDQLSLMAKFPVQFASEILEFIEYLITHPSFSEQELKKSIQEQSAQIIEQGDHPIGLISRELFPFLFPDHFYGYYALGHQSVIRTFSSEDVLAFWHKQTRMPLVFSICGRFDEGLVTEVASRLTETVQESSFEIPADVEWSQRRHMRLYMSERHQAHIVVVFPIPGLGHVSNPALSLVKMILAGQGGILFQEFREKYGLGYHVSPILWRTPVAGLIGFYIGSYPEQTQRCLEHFQYIVDKLKKEHISSSTLSRAQNLLQIEYSRERQPLLNRCCEASGLLSYHLDRHFYKKMINKAMKLGSQDVMETIAAFFDWQEAYTVIVSPDESRAGHMGGTH